MFNDMEKWTEIRREILTGRMSRREACKKYELNFRTIQKVLRSEEPPAHRKKVQRDKPVIGPFIPIIHEILEADKKVHAKQRHTGKRIFERVCDEHKYQGGETVPWTRRRELGLALREAFTSGVASDAALDLAHQLAADPKWEVRHTVADSLAVVPQDDYDRLASRLLADSNTYVRRAAQRAQDRRKKEAAASSRKRRSADHVHEHLQAIEAEYGKAAAAKALRMCERYNELFVSSMVHDLRSIVTHHKANCHALIEGADNERGVKVRRARLRGDLELLERTIEDMATITQAAPRERRRERLAVVVDEALDLARNNVRKLGLDPEMVAVEVDVPGSIVVEIARPLNRDGAGECAQERVRSLRRRGGRAARGAD